MVLFLILYFSLILPVQAGVVPVQVVKVCDGDTVKLKRGKSKFSLRLAGIDCYETGKINRAYKQAYLNKITIEEVVRRGKCSKEYLKARVSSGTNFGMEVTNIGRYKRPIGDFYIDGVKINQEMIKKGGCFAY